MTSVSDLEIVALHTPVMYRAEGQTYICGQCTDDHGTYTVWPCPERLRVGHAIAHPSNALLPEVES